MEAEAAHFPRCVLWSREGIENYFYSLSMRFLDNSQLSYKLSYEDHGICLVADTYQPCNLSLMVIQDVGTWPVILISTLCPLTIWPLHCPHGRPTHYTVFSINVEVAQGRSFYLVLFLLCVILRYSVIPSRSCGFSSYLQAVFCIRIPALVPL